MGVKLGLSLRKEHRLSVLEKGAEKDIGDKRRDRNRGLEKIAS